jgi:peptide/nickel transport system ATP-binding protein
LNLLEIDRLTLRAGAVTVLDGVSLGIAPGEFLAVVGESGSGKTMLARAVMRLLPEGISQTGGRIALDGEDLGAASPARMRALRGPGLGMVFQEPMVSLNPAMTIGAQLAEGMRIHRRLAAQAIRDLCLAMLERVRIGDPARALAAWPHEFSGGMRQRIMLASVMLLRPKLLIADEPTTALDTLSQREVLDLMGELARDQGSAVMLITHNLGLVGRYADRALLLRRGAEVETGPARALLRAPREPYTRALVDALPRPGNRKPVSHEGEPALRVAGLEVRYPGRRRWIGRAAEHAAVRGVDLDVWPGEVVAVVGGSGSGKTSLGRAVMGLAPVSAGSVTMGGVRVDGGARSPGVRAARLASHLIFQDPHSSLDPRMRVGALVAEPLRLVPGLSRAERRQRAEAMLDRVGLDGFANRFPHALSGGQRQRVAIARALVRRPALVVADEPVSALDMTVQAQILALLEALQAEYRFACLFISHDLGAVQRIADRVVVMQAGVVVESGACAAVFASPEADYTRALIAAEPVLAATDETVPG